MKCCNYEKFFDNFERRRRFRRFSQNINLNEGEILKELKMCVNKDIIDELPDFAVMDICDVINDSKYIRKMKNKDCSIKAIVLEILLKGTAELMIDNKEKIEKVHGDINE